MDADGLLHVDITLPAGMVIRDESELARYLVSVLELWAMPN